MLRGHGARRRGAEGADLGLGRCAISNFVRVNPCCQVGIRITTIDTLYTRGTYAEGIAADGAAWSLSPQHCSAT